ncbi:MAG: hypothetical protein QOG91_291 [Candidatus Parcubacteria bacterium]|nr:hypothetical protein [Candidatus Parcubacteria bacterium]
MIGGGAGYLGYEFKTVLWAVKTAWLEVVRECRDGFARVGQGIKIVLMIGGAGLMATAYVLAIIIPLFAASASWFVLLEAIGRRLAIGNSEFFLTVSFESAIGIFPIMFGYMLFNMKIPADDEDFWTKPTNTLRVFIDTNVIAVMLRLIRIVIIRVLPKIPGVAVLLGKIVRRIFILIHSEIRLLCMTDSMIGALAGYYWGNALVGGIIGAACGMLNYKLISVRWLKLAPR